jgi:hypothetical protein
MFVEVMGIGIAEFLIAHVHLIFVTFGEELLLVDREKNDEFDE